MTTTKSLPFIKQINEFKLYLETMDEKNQDDLRRKKLNRLYRIKYNLDEIERETEEPNMVCDNRLYRGFTPSPKCIGWTTPDQQEKNIQGERTWQWGWFAFCKECQKQ